MDENNSCLYLINLGDLQFLKDKFIIPNNLKLDNEEYCLLKFGQTTNFKNRFGAHKCKFKKLGCSIEILYTMKTDELKLSDYEYEVKSMFWKNDIKFIKKDISGQGYHEIVLVKKNKIPEIIKFYDKIPEIINYKEFKVNFRKCIKEINEKNRFIDLYQYKYITDNDKYLQSNVNSIPLPEIPKEYSSKKFENENIERNDSYPLPINSDIEKSSAEKLLIEKTKDKELDIKLEASLSRLSSHSERFKTLIDKVKSRQNSKIETFSEENIRDIINKNKEILKQNEELTSKIKEVLKQNEELSMKNKILNETIEELNNKQIDEAKLETIINKIVSNKIKENISNFVNKIFTE